MSASTVTQTSQAIILGSAASQDSGLLSSYGIQYVNDVLQTQNPLQTSASGLMAGTCYELGIVLFCGTVQGDRLDVALCTQFQLTITSRTTTSVTLATPLDETTRANNNVQVTSYQLAVDGAAKVDALKTTPHTISGLTEPGTTHEVIASLATDTGQTFSDVTLSFCLKPVAASIDHTQTVVTDSVLGFQYPTVGSGISAGFKIRVSGCSLASAVVKEQTSGSFSFDNLPTAGCKYDVTVTSYCTESGGQVDGDALTFEQCTS